MLTITWTNIGDICDGIEALLSTAIGVRSSTSFDELTEGIPSFDCPRVEVYWDQSVCDPSGGTDRTTFNACVQQSVITIFADLYARQRSQMGEDMKAVVDLVDAIIPVLQAQQKPPFFGIAGIRAINWSAKRKVFIRAKGKYVGARFTIKCRVF